MNTFGMILFILFAIAFVASFAYGVKVCIDLKKDPRTELNYKEYIKKLVICGVIATISFPVMMSSIYIWNSMSPSGLQLFKVIFGGLVFGASSSCGTFSFIVHYYRKGLPEKLDKILFITLMVSIWVIFISFLMVTDGFADFMDPHQLLPNGISFTTGLAYPNSGSPNIAFYALCILTGAVFVYFLADHKHYMKYGRHGMLESVFLLAFPAGIIGARIFYVIGNWNLEFANREFWHVFAIWEGGLTILGGAFLGIVVGVLWYMHVNKDASIWDGVDIIVPMILIAQAIGRWGNFFNCEVHGGMVPESSWEWLPRIVYHNAHYSSAKGWATEGFIWAPLFFIEFLVNMFGYCFLSHFVLNFLGKRNISKPGDAAIGYAIWYGFTRVFMEPIRDASFNMGDKGFWSWFWSLIFVAVGIIALAANHLVRNILERKKDDYKLKESSNFDSLIGVAIFGIVSISFIVIGSIMMANYVGELVISLNQFNVGIIFLVVGCSLLTCTSLPIYCLIDNYKLERAI